MATFLIADEDSPFSTTAIITGLGGRVIAPSRLNRAGGTVDVLPSGEIVLRYQLERFVDCVNEGVIERRAISYRPHHANRDGRQVYASFKGTVSIEEPVNA